MNNMPHERKRHLAAVLRHLAKLSPLVGLVGHRQVGKTTLLEAVSGSYLSFDDEDELKRAARGAKKFLSSLRTLGTAIDECQLLESLFPALKERVRLDRRPGQFYLSGSVRFTSKKVIRESLTGRIMTVDLLPLTLSELDRRELPDLALRLLGLKRLRDLRLARLSAAEFARRSRLIRHYKAYGGLPGACFIRQDRIRTQKILDQLETILNRDLRQIHETTLTLPDLMRFVRELSLREGGSVQLQELRRETGISPITQKKLIFALESVFVIRSLPLEGDFRGSAVVFEDQGEVSVLAQNRLDEERAWAGLVYRNLREQFAYRIGANAEFFQYRTRGGVLVPFAVRVPEATLGFVPVLGAPGRASVAAAQSFLRRYANSFALLVTDTDEFRVLDDRTVVIPAARLLFE